MQPRRLRSRVVLSISLLAAAPLSALGCGFAGCSGSSPECAGIRRDYFYGQSIAATLRRFERQDLPTKYEIYQCGMQAIHPPATYLIEPLAREGEAARELLEAELARSSGDLTILNILQVLEGMRVYGTADVVSEESVRLMRAKIGEIEDDANRAMAEEILRSMASER